MLDVKKMKKIRGRLTIKNVLLVGVVALVLGMAVLPAMTKSTGEVTAGFMEDGEKVPFNPLFSFVNPAGDSVDGVWMRVGWTVTGENVQWQSFRVWGNYGIKLWQSGVHIILVNKTFDMTETPDTPIKDVPYFDDAFDLAVILDGQPYSDAADGIWYLYFWADFHMSVLPTDPEYEGHTLYDMWDGETPTALKVYWTGGTFSGTGSVSSGW